MDDLAARVRAARSVYLIGNGGSWANAEHIANDLVNSCGVRAFSMSGAALTASANDFGYETVFSRWISTVGEAGDLLIALSGSGTSSNILRAVEIAKIKGMDVWTEYGAAQGFDMQASEERQIWLGHELMRRLKK